MKQSTFQNNQLQKIIAKLHDSQDTYLGDSQYADLVANARNIANLVDKNIEKLDKIQQRGGYQLTQFPKNSGGCLVYDAIEKNRVIHQMVVLNFAEYQYFVLLEKILAIFVTKKLVMLKTR